MEYNRIVAVTGIPGLYEILSSKSDGALVRSLEDKSTKFVSSRVHNFSHLESIEVFTVRDNVNLTEIFHAMEKEGGNIPDGKDASALKKYFEKVYPDLDFERVYSSDLKKMARWFEVLQANNIEIKLTEREEEAEEPAVPETETDVKELPAAPAKNKPATAAESKGTVQEDKPKKSAPKKKAETKQASAEEKTEKESSKAPAKKAAPKKKS